MKKLVLALAASVALTFPAIAGTIQIDDAVAHIEEGGREADVFMEITNSGDTPDMLYAVKTKAANSVKLRVEGHDAEEAMEAAGETATTSMALEVALGATSFDEDGSHIKLDDLTASFEEGDTFTVTLFFEQAGPVKVEVTVTAEE